MNAALRAKSLPGTYTRLAADTAGEALDVVRSLGIRGLNVTAPHKPDMLLGVDRVDPDGVAAEAGLGPNVLIRKVGRTSVAAIAEFAAALEKESPDDGVVLQVRTPRGNAVVLLKKGL